MAAASGSNAVDPSDVEAGVHTSQKKKKTYTVEKQEIPAEPLSAVPLFPLYAAGFCALRLVRLVLLAAAFSDGPHKEDVGAQFGIAMAWLAVFTGLLGALFLHAPLKEWIERADLPPFIRVGWEPMALRLLAAAVLIDMFHLFLSSISWKYFWSIGVVTDARAEEEPFSVFLAIVLIVLHTGGLFGLAMMVCSFYRSYRESWRSLGSRKVAVGDLGSGLRAGSDKDADEGRSNVYSATPQNPAGTSAPSTGKPPRAPTTSTPGKETVGGSSSSTSGPRHPPEAPPNPPDGARGYTPRGGRDAAPDEDRGFAGDADRRVGTPPRAWLWSNDEWVRVRIIRSTGDGTASVRLIGGTVVHTRQTLLRPRGAEDDDPPSQPPRQPQSRPASASRARPGSAGREKRGPSPSERPSSACPPQQQPEADDNSEGAKWAATRLEQLRKELIDLEKLEPAEKRSRLRNLQRELHPDKQPPDLRAYAQPLFHLVQREWEVDEASRAASKQ